MPKATITVTCAEPHYKQEILRELSECIEQMYICHENDEEASFNWIERDNVIVLEIDEAPAEESTDE